MKTAENIVLIGMPGSGKSTLGVILAEMLDYKFVDCDALIQNQYEQTLEEIIDACGTQGFLEVENRVLSTVDTKKSIISTGGSAVYSPEAMKHLSHIGVVVYLQINPESLMERLGDLKERGVVMRDGIGMSVVDLYRERLPLYEHYAEITVDVNNLDIVPAAEKVAEAIKANCKIL